MRPTSFVWLLSVALAVHAIPIPGDVNDLTTVERFALPPGEVDETFVKRDDLNDELEKRAKAPVRAPVRAPTRRPPAKAAARPPPARAPARAPARPPTRPGVKPPPKAVKPPAKPPVKPPVKGATPPAAAACPIKKPGTTKGPRSFFDPRRITDYWFEKRAIGSFKSATAPATITIKLGGKSFNLRKFASQGGRGITYTVVDGANAGDFAKTNFNGKSEIDNTTAAGQTVASGRDQNTCNAIQAEWLIVKKSPGKKITDTAAFRAATTKAQCQTVLANAVKFGGQALITLNRNTGLNHNDISLDNVRFNDAVSQAFLIDFGESTRGPLIAQATLKASLEAVFDPADLCPAT